MIFPHKFYPQIIAVKALIHHEGRYLLLREAPSASWRPGRLGLPGGKIDPTETWHTALSRELQEEIGVMATPTALASIEEIVCHNPSFHCAQLTHHFLFLCTLTPDALETLSSNPAISWHSLEELQKIPLANMTEFYFTALWNTLASPSFHPLPLPSLRVWNSLQDPTFQAWLRT